MKSSRRTFIKNFSIASAWLLVGGIQKLTAADVLSLKNKVTFRFAVASDGHYGQANTDFDHFYEQITQHINLFHHQAPLQGCVVNGDIIHDKKEFLAQAKQKLDQLAVPYYVTKGNHDQVSDDYWKEVWNVPVNYEIFVKKNTFLMLSTSNEKGEYLSPDLTWLKGKLDEHKSQKNIFMFLHIPQYKWTANAIDTPAFFELVKGYSNIKAVFHGHEHDQDTVKIMNDVPYFFDSHFGGSWGTAYRGFRVVELLKDNTMITYIMNPLAKINESTH
jgi:calcineurin-like phosphoesterase family protein